MTKAGSRAWPATIPLPTVQEAMALLWSKVAADGESLEVIKEVQLRNIMSALCLDVFCTFDISLLCSPICRVGWECGTGLCVAN